MTRRHEEEIVPTCAAMLAVGAEFAERARYPSSSGLDSALERLVALDTSWFQALDDERADSLRGSTGVAIREGVEETAERPRDPDRDAGSNKLRTEWAALERDRENDRGASLDLALLPEAADEVLQPRGGPRSDLEDVVGFAGDAEAVHHL